MKPPNHWYVLIPFIGNYIAHKRILYLIRHIEELNRNRRNLINDLGGNIERLKVLLSYHGSVDKIEDLLKNIDTKNRNNDLISPLERKYGSVDAVLSRIDKLESSLSKKSEELSSLQSLIGGSEGQNEIKKLKENYGSFYKIYEKLENIENLTRNLPNSYSLQENIDFINNLKKYGSFEDIQNKLSLFDSLKSSHSQNEYKIELMSKELDRAKKDLDAKNNRIQTILMGIGGEELISTIKYLRDKYGSLESIKSNLEEFNIHKREVIEIKEKMRNIEEKNRINEQKIIEGENKYQNIMQRLGGIEEFEFAEQLKNTHASFRSIKEKMDSIPSMEDKWRRMNEIDEYIGEDTWILDQLREKILSRRNKLNVDQGEIESNFLKLGEKFRQECVDILNGIFLMGDTEAFFDVEKDRKDITAVFIVEGSKRFEVVIECKAIEQYYRNEPIVLVPPMREKDIDSVKEQLKKADRQLSSVGHKKLKVTVISVPHERFEEYGIKNELILSDSKRFVEKIVIGKSCLRPLLLSLRVLCKNFTPELNFEQLVETYSNPEYADMIREIYDKIVEWNKISDGLIKNKDRVDNEYRKFTQKFEKIKKFMLEWTEIVNSQWDKATNWSTHPKLLTSSEEAEVELLEELDEEKV